jgi:hypothetical protein
MKARHLRWARLGAMAAGFFLAASAFLGSALRTLVPPLGPAYVKMLTDQGPPQAL